MKLDRLDKFSETHFSGSLEVLPIRPRVEGSVLAFDQTLSNTGWVLMKAGKVSVAGNIKPQSDLTGHEGNLTKALMVMDEATDLIHLHRPSLVVCETPPVGSRMMRPESSLLAALAIKIAVRNAGFRMDIVMINAQQAKKRITGNARAAKSEVKEGVIRLDPDVLRLKPLNEHIIDAIALGWVASEVES